MNSAVKNMVQITEKQAQYDEKAKHLLGQKIILAHILAKTVTEFSGMNPKDIMPLIEGEPQIGIVPVEPGMTNATKEKNGEQIIGFNTENSQINEGLIRFDIVFYVRIKDGLAQMIINLEMQKDNPSKYKLLNRGIFYACRLISSQKGRDFLKSNYNDIKSVYSIWLCMNMEEDSITHIHLTQEQLLGNCTWQGNLDMLNIVFIGLAKKLAKRHGEYELHRLLGALLSNELSADRKLDIIENEYHIPVEEKIRGEMVEMCNLGQGVYEKGEAQGIAQGIALNEAKLITSMHENGLSIEMIAQITKKATEEILSIIEEKDT